MVVAVALAMAAVAATLSACGSDDDGGGAEAFCAEVADNVDAIARPSIVTADDVDATIGLYRELADRAPIAIEQEWRDLLFNIETASTVVPDDPASVQRTVAVAFATEKSAVAVRDWVLANCGVDLGPVSTIAPQGPAATTTLPPEVSTSLVTVQAPTTTLAPVIAATTPPSEVPTTTATTITTPG